MFCNFYFYKPNKRRCSLSDSDYTALWGEVRTEASSLQRWEDYVGSWRKGVNQRESLRVGLELFRRLVLLLLLEEEELENV